MDGRKGECDRERKAGAMKDIVEAGRIFLFCFVLSFFFVLIKCEFWMDVLLCFGMLHFIYSCLFFVNQEFIRTTPCKAELSFFIFLDFFLFV